MSNLAGFDVAHIYSFILIQWNSLTTEQDLYSGRWDIFDRPTQHPAVSWASLYTDLFGLPL